MFALHDHSLEISKSCLADANTCDVITDCQTQDVLFSQIYMHLRFVVCCQEDACAHRIRVPRSPAVRNTALSIEISFVHWNCDSPFK